MAALDRIGASAGTALAPLRAAATVANPLVLPRLVLQAAYDIRSIAENTRSLQATVTELAEIAERTASLDREVARMRAAVEAIGGEVEQVRTSVAPLERELGDLRSSIEPLRSAALRLGRLGRMGRSRPTTGA